MLLVKYVNEAYDFVNHAWSKGKIQKLIAPLEGLAYCTTVKGFKEVGLGVQPGATISISFIRREGFTILCMGMIFRQKIW